VFHAGTADRRTARRHQRRPRAVRHRAGRFGALAQQRAYELCARSSSTAQWRNDIGHRAIKPIAGLLAPLDLTPGLPPCPPGTAATTSTEMIDTTAVRNYLLGLQQGIVSTFEAEDGLPSAATAGRARPAASCRVTACRS
jgi:hypothetical protein